MRLNAIRNPHRALFFRKGLSLRWRVALTMRTSSLSPQGWGSLPSVKKDVCVLWIFACVFTRLPVLQSGSGGGVGAAAGATGPSGEGQRVVGTPRSGRHCSLLGRQRTPSLCRGRGGQGVFSPCRILQSGQGSDG